jgi:HSP20 family protein
MTSTASNAVEQGNGKAATERRRPLRVTVPDVDVFENADELLVVADVPGVRSESVDVRVEHDTLTIEARHDGPADASPALAREYEEVDYKRTFRIPAGIDAPNVHAEAKNGVVRVHLPKAAAAKPRKVAVRSS